MKLQIRKLITKKLFYGEYAFKIAAVVKGGSLVRSWGPQYLQRMTGNVNSPITKLKQQELEKLQNFTWLLTSIPKKDVKTRFEGNHVNLFFKDRKSYVSAVDSLKDYIVEIHEPANDIEFQALVDHKKYVIVDQYPHGVYTHKVVFKYIHIKEERQNILNWLLKYPTEDIRISPTSKLYLSGQRIWAQDPFLLIRDEKMVTMLHLGFNEYIKHTEKYVLRSSINIES